MIPLKIGRIDSDAIDWVREKGQRKKFVVEDNEFEFVYIESTIRHPERAAWILAQDGILNIIMESDTRVGKCSVEENYLRGIKEEQEQSFAGMFH